MLSQQRAPFRIDVIDEHLQNIRPRRRVQCKTFDHKSESVKPQLFSKSLIFMQKLFAHQ